MRQVQHRIVNKKIILPDDYHKLHHTENKFLYKQTMFLNIFLKYLRIFFSCIYMYIHEEERTGKNSVHVIPCTRFYR